MSSDWGFVQRRGLALHEGDDETFFCFVSFNIPELTFIQDPWRLPTKYVHWLNVRSGPDVCALTHKSPAQPQVGDSGCSGHHRAAGGAGGAALHALDPRPNGRVRGPPCACGGRCGHGHRGAERGVFPSR